MLSLFIPIFLYVSNFSLLTVPGFTSIVISASSEITKFALIVLIISAIYISSITEGVPPPI